MKKPINEIKRMQRIAGLITESEYQESFLSKFANDSRVNLTVGAERMKKAQNALQLVANSLQSKSNAEGLIILQDILKAVNFKLTDPYHQGKTWKSTEADTVLKSVEKNATDVDDYRDILTNIRKILEQLIQQVKGQNNL